jgi:hypothetical protein
MKLSAVIFILPLSFLMIQPVFNTQQSVDQLQCCSKMNCHKKNHTANKNEKCGNNACNPFMACAYGNFFTNDNSSYCLTIYGIGKERIGIANDNRLYTCLSDCWHPPESIIV